MWCQAGHAGSINGHKAVILHPCGDIAQHERQPITAVSRLIHYKRGRPALLRMRAKREQKARYQCDISTQRVHFYAIFKVQNYEKKCIFQCIMQ